MEGILSSFFVWSPVWLSLARHDRYNPSSFRHGRIICMVNEQRLKIFVKESRLRFEDLLGQMVEVPSISMDSSRASDMRRMADLAKQYLAGMNADVHVVETDGYPMVSGGWVAGPNYPTVTIYNHLDVQPAQEPEWRQSPFAFKNENGIYRG